MAFNPNETTLEEGLELVNKLQKELRIDKTKIFTSKDVPNLYRHKTAQVTNVPEGFSKVILPFYVKRSHFLHLIWGTQCAGTKALP